MPSIADLFLTIEVDDVQLVQGARLSDELQAQVAQASAAYVEACAQVCAASSVAFAALLSRGADSTLVEVLQAGAQQEVERERRRAAEIARARQIVDSLDIIDDATYAQVLREYTHMQLTHLDELLALDRNRRRLQAGNTMRRKLRRAMRRGLL